MRILILGSNGMLGSICKKYFDNKKYKVDSFNKYFSFDKSDDYFNEVRSYDSDIIVNCIGKIKQKTINFSDLMAINAVFPYLLSLNKHDKSVLVQPSTDCIFAGDLKNKFYDINHISDAEDAYGISKAFGENSIANRKDVLILRGSIIGIVEGKTESLMDWFLSHPDRDTVDGYENHFWNGITTLQWCKNLESLIENGVLNYGNKLQFGTKFMHSKYYLLEKINQAFNRDININAMKTKDSINRCLESNFPLDIPPIEQQLEELYLYLNPQKKY